VGYYAHTRVTVTPLLFGFPASYSAEQCGRWIVWEVAWLGMERVVAELQVDREYRCWLKLIFVWLVCLLLELFPIAMYRVQT
jgi:hypothetical protein